MWERSWPSVIGSAAGVVDRAFLAAIRVRGATQQDRVDAVPQAEQIARLADTHRVYEGDAFITDVARFFPAPPVVNPTPRLVRRGVWELAWPSAFEPFLAEVRARCLAHVENRTARARVYVGVDSRRSSSMGALTKRPAIIAVHGWLGGHWILEENQWPVDWLVRRGLDVVLPVLPHHAGRGTHRGTPAFPSSDPRLTIEGFRQAVIDIRSLVRWLRERGAPHVGITGMSLGGYTSALIATVTDDIDFVMPMIPLASIADFAREQGRVGIEGNADEHHAAIERAHWVVSPLARPLRLPKERALVVAAEHDRITPVAHAARIATHFGCELMTIAGGHVVPFGRGGAYRSLVSMLEREGIIAPRR